jgi:aminoglycoside phosphotransferase (APT) family kinase protein
VPTLRPVLNWLDASRPAQEEHVVCHGDVVFGNVLEEGGRVTAVLDWNDGAIGSRWFDVARTVDSLTSVPLYGRRAATRFLAAYRRHAGWHEAHYTWHQVLRYAHDLARVARWRRTRQPADRTELDCFARTTAERLQQLTGHDVRVPRAPELATRLLEYWPRLQLYRE